MVSFNISVQTLTLLYQIMDSRDSVNDRWAEVVEEGVVRPGQVSRLYWMDAWSRYMIYDIWIDCVFL